MSVNKSMRLSQVARELNVGISTIVEFLHKKGIEIDSMPTAKIEAEFCDMLFNAFSSDQSAKKESEKLTQKKINTKESQVKLKREETDSIEKTKNTAINNLQIKKTNITEKNTNINNSQLTETTTFYKEVNKEIKGPKILGKIDLDNPERFVKKEEKIENIQEIELSIEKKEVIAETQKIEKVLEENSNVIEPEIIEPVKQVEPKLILKSKEDKQKLIENSEPKIEEKKVITKPFESELISNVPQNQEENDIKIVGRIDLSLINQKTRPDKKTKKEREKERIDRDKASKLALEKSRIERLKLKNDSEEKEEAPVIKKKIILRSAQENVEDNTSKDFIKTKVDQLAGPTVVGKIELNDDKLADDKRKRKKKRKRKRLNPAVNTEEVPVVAGEKVKKVIHKKKDIKLEVDDKQVQSQVKETLAKLTLKQKKSAVKHRKDKRTDVKDKMQKEIEQQEIENKILQVTEFISANELASLMNIPVNKVISTCFDLGRMVQINQRLDAETIAIVAEEHGFEVSFVSVAVHEAIEDTEEDNVNLITRPPIVTVMGHVDHGKTSLLDYIRNTNVIAGEAGGITQHIGAYNVLLKNGQRITFLDTPGHEAFTAMRARGAKVTDIAIIVVAADDNVMPQTIEAINHAQAAGVPIVFAINKIDKEGANPEKIKKDLAQMNLLVEEWGGKYQSKDISAKRGLFVDELLDEVILAAEMLELKANPNRKAKGSIIESSLDKGRGYISTILVETGTLKVGDVILAGEYSGKVKAMFNERNVKIKTAGPSEPAIILGLSGAPQAGDNFHILDSEKEAREFAAKYHRIKREQALRAQKHITLDEIGRRLKIGNFQQLNVIVKADFDGSVEALTDSLIKLSTEEIQINVIHKAVGQISEADVMLAAASDAIIIGFQVRPSPVARKLAESEEIEIRLYSIIYDAIAELKDAMEGMLSPEIREEITATVEIREVFRITKVGNIAGCYVLDGKITRDNKIRLIRDGIVVYNGDLGTLKRFKDDVKEVSKGFECGLNIEKYNDMQVGDIIEAYKQVEFAKTL